MPVRTEHADRSAPRRVMTHPAVWSVPVMVLLVFVAMRFNDGSGRSRGSGGFYLYWINGDPEGDAQVDEWVAAGRVFRYTAAVLCGQFLALLAGVALARRHAQVAALVRAVPLAAVLAGVTVAVGYPLARAQEVGHFVANRPLDPVLVRVLVCELAAYPLYAVAGVGIGTLLGRRWRLPAAVRRPVGAVIVIGWCVATLAGLWQDDRFDGPAWLLWTVPLIAAGNAVALAGTSIDVYADPPVVVGDWGRGASTALLVSAAAYALVLNLLGWLAAQRRRGAAATGPPAAIP